MTKSAVFRWLMINIIAGIGIESFIAIPIMLVWLAGTLCIMALALAWRRAEKNIAIGAFLCLGLLGGIMRMDYAVRAAPDMRAFSDARVLIVGTVAEDPNITEKSQRMRVNAQDISGRRLASPVGIMVIAKKYPSYRQGDRVRLEGMLAVTPYDGMTSAALFSRKEEKIGEQPMLFFLKWMRDAKRAFDAHIDEALPEPHASFMKGLLLGEKTSMPKNILDEFKQAGVSHIIALSGYNITIVGALVVDILLMLTIPFRLTFWLAGAFIIFFVLLAGASASLMRAAIMGMLVLIAAREGRMYHMTNALVCAGAVMLMANPYLLRFDAGFQLSFLATLGLIYFTAPVERALSACAYRIRMRWRGKRMPRKESRIASGIKKIMSETIAAQLGVLPLLVFLFGGVSIVAPVSNLFVLAVVPYAMAFGFFTGMAGFASARIAALVGWGAWALLSYELAAIRLFARIPSAFVNVPFAGAVGVVMVYGAIAMRHLRKRAMQTSSATDMTEAEYVLQ